MTLRSSPTGMSTCSPTIVWPATRCDFQSGRVELRHDEAWHDKLSRSHRLIVTMITAPLLARYRYIGKRR